MNIKLANRRKMKMIYCMRNNLEFYADSKGKGLPSFLIKSALVIRDHQYSNIPASIFRADKPKIDQRRKRRYQRRQKKFISKFTSILSAPGEKVEINLNDSGNSEFDVKRMVSEIKARLLSDGVKVVAK